MGVNQTDLQNHDGLEGSMMERFDVSRFTMPTSVLTFLSQAKEGRIFGEQTQLDVPSMREGLRTSALVYRAHRKYLAMIGRK